VEQLKQLITPTGLKERKGREDPEEGLYDIRLCVTDSLGKVKLLR